MKKTWRLIFYFIQLSVFGQIVVLAVKNHLRMVDGFKFKTFNNFFNVEPKHVI